MLITLYSQLDFFYLQLLVSGQPTTNAGSSPASGGGSLSPGGSAGVGALSPGGTSSTGPAQCCESGRPLVTDPVTGQSVCSCQYDPARLAALQYPRSVSVYGAPYPSTDQNPYPSIGVESSAFYSPLVSLIFHCLFRIYSVWFNASMIFNTLSCTLYVLTCGWCIYSSFRVPINVNNRVSVWSSRRSHRLFNFICCWFRKLHLTSRQTFKKIKYSTL